MVPIVSIVVICFLQYGAASAPAEEWYQFPQLRHVDEFSHCLGDKGGVYCTADIEFVAEAPNELYDAMREYSKPYYRFNRTKAIYGYCMTRRCKEFLTGDSEAELRLALGACLNSTLQREYGLRARIDSSVCYRHGEGPTVSFLEWAAVVLLIMFAALVAAGTFYDLFVTNKDSKGYLMCFSLPANWAKLIAPWPQNPETAPLIGLNGLRSITNIIVIYLHAMLYGYYSKNIEYIENLYQSSVMRVATQTNLIMQTFFFLSGLLLAYNTERSNERNPKTRRSLPKAILLRWLRLAPVPYAVLLFSVTWYKFCPVGPIYQVVQHDFEDCRRNWLGIFFFCSNYMDKVFCNLHFWSTAADFHMHIVGLTIMLLSPTKRVRNSLLWMLLIIGLALPAIETYFRELHGTFVITPEFMQVEKMINHKTFSHLYSRTHCNIPSFAIGMLLGILLNDWQKNPIDFTKYKKYTILYWVLLPVLLVLSLWSAVLLWGRADMSTRLLVTVLRNPAWTVTLALFTVGVIYKVEKVAVYRRVLEWPGWVPLARITYCSYNVNPAICMWYIGSSHTLFTGSTIHSVIVMSGMTIISFVTAAALWLVVEAPCSNIVVKLFPEKRSSLRVYSADDADKTN